MFLNIRPEQIKSLPRYEGDLLLTDHSAGLSLRRLIRNAGIKKNELLADAAEKPSIGAWVRQSRVSTGTFEQRVDARDGGRLSTTFCRGRQRRKRFSFRGTTM